MGRRMRGGQSEEAADEACLQGGQAVGRSLLTLGNPGSPACPEEN